MQQVKPAEFAAAHSQLSLLWTGSDEDFARKVCTLWGLSPDGPLAKTTGAVRQSAQKPQSTYHAADRVWPDVARAAAAGKGSEAARLPGGRGAPDLPGEQQPVGQAPRRDAAPQRVLAEGRRQNFEASMQGSDEVRLLLGRIREALARRGGDSLAGLARRFRLSAHSNNRVGAEELEVALRHIGVGLSEGEMVRLFAALDVDRSGYIDFEEWLKAIRGPLSARRAAVVREVFRRLDSDGDGRVSAEELQAHFQSTKHSNVTASTQTGREVLLDLLAKLGDRNRDGFLTEQEFITYYENVSASIDSDDYFLEVVQSAWGLNSSPYTLAARHKRHAYNGHLFQSEGGLIG